MNGKCSCLIKDHLCLETIISENAVLKDKLRTIQICSLFRLVVFGPFTTYSVFAF